MSPDPDPAFKAEYRSRSRTSKLQEKPSVLIIEHQALRNMFLNFFLVLWVIFALLDPDPDPDPDSESGSRCNDLIESETLTLAVYYFTNLNIL